MKKEKISPELQSMMVDFEEAGHDGLEGHIGTLGIVSEANSLKPPRSVVFIHCDGQANLDHLKEAGIRVNKAKGKYEQRSCL